MSHVTNVLVAVGVANWGLGDTPPGIIEMNKTLAKEANGQILLCIDESVGGLKNLEIPVFAAAFNYVSVDTIVRVTIGAHWENPQQVQLMICDQEDYIFIVKTVEEWTSLYSHMCSKCDKSLTKDILYTYEDSNGKWHYFCSENCFLSYLDGFTTTPHK